MSDPKSPNKSNLKYSIMACLENGNRLILDAEMLELSNPPSTAYALIIIAQEEFAKAFLLTLVYKDIIQWNRLILRATRDHVCKQLLSMVMDYIYPDDDEFFKRIESWPKRENLDSLPSHIADALNILYHEKIRRWESQNWAWAEPPNYDSTAKRVAKGKIDKIKQDQLYVDIGNEGSVIPKIAITSKQFELEKERSERLCNLVRGMINKDEAGSIDFDNVIKSIKILFPQTQNAPNK